MANHNRNHRHRTRVFNWNKNELIWEDKFHDTYEDAILYVEELVEYEAIKIYDDVLNVFIEHRPRRECNHTHHTYA